MGLDGTYSSSDGSAPEDNGYTPSKKKAKRTPVKKTPEDNGYTPSKKAKRTPVKKTPTKARAIVIDSDSDSTLPLHSRRSSAKKPKSVTSSDSEDDIVHSNSRSSQIRKPSSRNANTFQGSPAITSSRVRGKKPVVNEESDSEEDDILPPSTRKRVPRATETEEDESQPIVSPLKRSRKPVESDDSDIVSSPMKRRRNTQHHVELSSESDFPSPSKMGPSSKRSSASKTPPRFTRQQKTARKHRTEKQKKMELLIRRRAGENIEQVTDSESDSDEGDEDEELQKLSEFEDEEPSPENTRKPAKGKARKQNSDSDTDDFVIEDEDGPLGIPTEHLAQIPLEFTSAAHKPVKEHFRDVVEWMVHNKVNPGFEWKDPVYETAFRKVDQEAGGFADSKFVSTQWTVEFTKAIYARPNLIIRDVDPGEAINVLGEAKCEACNHRKHMPTFSIQLKGKAYNKITLEDIESDSDEDSDDDSDSEDSSKASRDERGQTLLSEDKEWFAGR
jgi:hypothetical protein